MFRSPEPGSRKIVGKGQFALYNVLKAYSVHDRTVGYVQGMGSIASLCLMYMPEEDAFWVLERLLNSAPWSLAGLYTKGMPRAYYYLHIHQALFKKHLPRLFTHFEKENIFPSSYAFRWLTTRFSQFPLQLVVRLFDMFLAEGEKILFRFAIYCLKVREKDFLKLDFEHVTEELNDLYRHPEFADADKCIEGVLDVKITHKEIIKFGDQYWDEQKQLNGGGGEPSTRTGSRSHKDKKHTPSRGSENDKEERSKSTKKGRGSASVSTLPPADEPSSSSSSSSSSLSLGSERPKSTNKKIGLARGSEKLDTSDAATSGTDQVNNPATAPVGGGTTSERARLKKK